MNGQEWQPYAELRPMLDILSSKASDRKWRLFACACCRRSWEWMTDERSRNAVEAADSRDELKVAKRVLSAAVGGAEAVVWEISESVPGGHTHESLARFCAAYAAAFILKNEKWGDAKKIAMIVADRSLAAASFTEVMAVAEAVQEYHRQLAGDIFGNPFDPVIVNPAWLAWNNGAIAKLAQRIYDERSFADLPLLADALEEAGCTSAELLTHCRHPGPHVRGCWAVDLLLGKA